MCQTVKAYNAKLEKSLKKYKKGVNAANAPKLYHPSAFSSKTEKTRF